MLPTSSARLTACSLNSAVYCSCRYANRTTTTLEHGMRGAVPAQMTATQTYEVTRMPFEAITPVVEIKTPRIVSIQVSVHRDPRVPLYVVEPVDALLGLPRTNSLSLSRRGFTAPEALPNPPVSYAITFIFWRIWRAGLR